MLVLSLPLLSLLLKPSNAGSSTDGVPQRGEFVNQEWYRENSPHLNSPPTSVLPQSKLIRTDYVKSPVGIPKDNTGMTSSIPEDSRRSIITKGAEKEALIDQDEDFEDDWDYSPLPASPHPNYHSKQTDSQSTIRSFLRKPEVPTIRFTELLIFSSLLHHSLFITSLAKSPACEYVDVSDRIFYKFIANSEYTRMDRFFNAFRLFRVSVERRV